MFNGGILLKRNLNKCKMNYNEYLQNLGLMLEYYIKTEIFHNMVIKVYLEVAALKWRIIHYGSWYCVFLYMYMWYQALQSNMPRAMSYNYLRLQFSHHKKSLVNWFYINDWLDITFNLATMGYLTCKGYNRHASFFLEEVIV